MRAVLAGWDCPRRWGEMCEPGPGRQWQAEGLADRVYTEQPKSWRGQGSSEGSPAGEGYGPSWGRQQVRAVVWAGDRCWGHRDCGQL